ncbi:type II secretion system F family protein [Actinomycetota bacterium]
MIIAIIALCFLLAIPASLFAEEESELIINKFDTRDYPKVNIYLNFEEESDLGSLDLGVDDFSITENGEEISDIKVERIASTTEPIGVVLVLDTSGSMEGEPIEAAANGALVFMNEMRPIDEFALVGFSDEVTLFSNFTSDRTKLRESIYQMEAKGETALWDGILVGLNQFENKDTLKHKYLIVLTDGTDTVSKLTSNDVIAKADQEDVIIYSIALMSSDFNPEEIEVIATASNGELMVAAELDELRSLYEDISRIIRNQYKISYTSFWSDTESIEVGVLINKDESDGSVFTDYDNPFYAPSPTEIIRDKTPRFSGLFDIWWVTIIIYVGMFIGVVLFLYLFINLLIPRKQLLRDRTEIYGYRTGKGKAGDKDIGARGKQGAYKNLVSMVSKAAAKRGFGEMFELRLQRAGMSVRGSEFITIHLISIIIISITVYFLSRSYFFTFIVVFIVVLLPFLIINIRTGARIKRFHEQLPDTLQLVSGSLKAGYSFNQAISMVVEETSPPISEEFRRVLNEIRMGSPEREALESMAERISSEHFNWVVMAVNIQREVGGNLAEVMEIIASTIRERDQVTRQISALTAEGRLSAYILIGLPFAVGIIISFTNREYIGLLISSNIGLAMIGIAFLLMITGIIWILRIVKVEY